MRDIETSAGDCSNGPLPVKALQTTAPRGVILARPMQLGSFVLSPTGVTVEGDPAFEEWEGALQWAIYAHERVAWWIGDLLNIGETRYGEKYAQAIEVTGRDYQTLRDYAWVAQNVELSRRRDTLSWSHHREVASLSPAEQDTWLARVKAEQWTRSELRKALRAAKPRPVLPPGQFDLIVADPPWAYGNSGFDQSADQHYRTLDVEAIAQYTDLDGRCVPDLAAEDCVLFLWATSPLLPEALTVMAAWGFRYVGNVVWRKDKAPGLGWFLQTYHEHLLIGVRGTMHPAEKLPSVFDAAVREHSQKPEEAFALVERMYPHTRRVELFGRQTRPGWTVFGNEITGTEVAGGG